MLTVWGANCGLPTIGAVRVALEPKPGLPSDPDDPRAFIDIFTDIRGLFVINNESGWYERVDDPRPAGGRCCPSGPEGSRAVWDDYHRRRRPAGRHGAGNNVPGHFFTVDGNAPHFPGRATISRPGHQRRPASAEHGLPTNCLQQADCHSYWEFNYTTNWIHPLYELPFTGGFPDKSPAQPAEASRTVRSARSSRSFPETSPGTITGTRSRRSPS